MRKQPNTKMVKAAITAAAVELPAEAKEYLVSAWSLDYRLVCKQLQS
jgi:hypothetical protein